MVNRLQLGGIAVDVEFKNIKNVHLSVYPPHGRVRIAAPERMKLDTVRLFAISKLDWIRQQQKKLVAQEREAPREYLNRESHYVWGRRYLLKVIEVDQAPSIELTHRNMVLRVRTGADDARRSEIIEAWYREQLKKAAQPLIGLWGPILGVDAGKLFVQRMRTKWGSCNTASRSIRLNTELAKKPRDCLEYIVVHELAHLRERTHGARFIALMDRHLPNWRHRRQKLNSLPVRDEAWTY